MRLLALTSLILASTLATGAFAAPAESLNYNVVNLSAEASREISNDEMHAVLYIENPTNNQLNWPLKLTS